MARPNTKRSGAIPSGVKRTVVEREQNIVTLDEARAHSKECGKAMLDELTRWLNLGAFEGSPRKDATNVIDARWVLKWKEVNGKRMFRLGWLSAVSKTFKRPN